jgi:aldose 1-epimerase
MARSSWGFGFPIRRVGWRDVTLGYDTLEGWLADTNYLGASIGRFGNRIAHGKFQLDGKEYTLAKNNSPGDIPCHLHGGTQGFNAILWNAVPFETPDATGLRLHPYLEGRRGGLSWHTDHHTLLSAF